MKWVTHLLVGRMICHEARFSSFINKQIQSNPIISFWSQSFNVVDYLCVQTFCLLKHKGTYLCKFYFIKRLLHYWVRIASFWKGALLYVSGKGPMGVNIKSPACEKRGGESLNERGAWRCNEKPGPLLLIIINCLWTCIKLTFVSLVAGQLTGCAVWCSQDFGYLRPLLPHRSSPKFNRSEILILGLRMYHQLLEINGLSYLNMYMDFGHGIFFVTSWRYYISSDGLVKLHPCPCLAALSWLGIWYNLGCYLELTPPQTLPCGVLCHSWGYYDHFAQCAWPPWPYRMLGYSRDELLKFQGNKHISRSVRKTLFKYSIWCPKSRRLILEPRVSTKRSF